jgi:hypothetical protein
MIWSEGLSPYRYDWMVKQETRSIAVAPSGIDVIHLEA